MSIIERVKEHSLSDYLLSEGYELKPAGKGKFKMRCPFHDDSNPSMDVDDKKCYCWVCKKSWDHIDFVKESKSLNINDAIGSLCKSLNVPMDNKVNEEERKQFQALSWASSLFQSNLDKGLFKEIKAYLNGRGISDGVLGDFEVGFVPVGNFLKSRIKNNKESFLSTGLIQEGPEGEYDFFRNRIMFPIRNMKGAVIGFGGRINPFADTLNSYKPPPKYVNSQACNLYNKSTVLYGLYEAVLKSGVQRFDVIYVMEGYMDVIACHQAGIFNVVACCGTSISPDHMELLFKYTNHVCFVFDGDDAGRNGSEAALAVSIRVMSLINQVSFVRMSENKDAGDLVKEGKIEFLKGKLRFYEGFETIILKAIKSISGRSEFIRRCNQKSRLLEITSEMNTDLGKMLSGYVERELGL